MVWRGVMPMRNGCLPLALANRRQPGPEDFAHVGTVVQSQGQHAGPKPWQDDPKLGQGKEEEKDLQVERCTADQRNIKCA